MLIESLFSTSPLPFRLHDFTGWQDLAAPTPPPLPSTAFVDVCLNRMRTELSKDENAFAVRGGLLGT